MPQGYIEADGSYNERGHRRETKDERIARLYAHIESLKEDRDKWRDRSDRAMTVINLLCHHTSTEPRMFLKALSGSVTIEDLKVSLQGDEQPRPTPAIRPKRNQ